MTLTVAKLTTSLDGVKIMLAAAFAILAPIHAVMAATGFLIVMDTVTGIMAARKRGDVIKSASLRRSVSKMLVYQIAVITGFIAQKYLLADLIPVSSVVAAMIGMVELTSILENLHVVYGSNIFQGLLDKLGSKNDVDLQRKIEELTEKLKKDKEDA